MIKVRFNLGRGKNYKKWKITYADGTHETVDPNEYQLILTKCQLKNNKATAMKIFNGNHKLVCAWVMCDKVSITTNHVYNESFGQQIEYNPRKNPFWSLSEIDMDDCNFELIFSIGNKLFVY